MKHPGEYRNVEVVILGLARSGLAVAKVFHEFGAKVTVNDAKPREECPEAEELEALGIRVICGGHPDDLIHAGVELLVKNPGIKYTTAPIQKAIDLGIEIVVEIEVASYICKSPIIGITGSNGKTTTTTWVGRILEAAGQHPIVAGNIGRPLCDAAADSEPEEWMVVELSSFQLKATQNFHPRIACMLNLYETHLDYHGDMADYRDSKAMLFANQTPEDVAVLNWDDPVCRDLADLIQSRVIPFSRREKLKQGVFVEDQHIVYVDAAGSQSVVLPLSQFTVPGKHNLENVLAAIAITIAAGVPVHRIGDALHDLPIVEHRQEFVREKEGIRFYNDSKATNSSATITALDAFDDPIVWIGGGLDRGTIYTELVPWFENKVKAVILFGETRYKLQEAARRAGLQSVYVVDTKDDAADTMDQAVQLAYKVARAGDIILFSPACASWDMFETFEERGSMFKASVHNL
jgi:UDP-N-acetylmuramoylalanine--D-glutamate ligase